MKFLIWLGWLALGSAITTSLRYVGIMLGGIPTCILYALCAFGARKCCRAYDLKHKTPEELMAEEEEKERQKQEEAKIVAEDVSRKAWFFGGILCFVALVVVAVVLMCLA